MSYIDAVNRASEKLQAQTPVWMHAIQQRGRALWNAHAWPGKKTEAWRYTNLSKLERVALFTEGLPIPTKPDVAEILASKAISLTNEVRIVLVDGIYSPDLSTATLPAGLVITAFSALTDAQARLLTQRLGSIVETEKYYFVAQNESLLRDGLLIQVVENVKIREPINLVCVNTTTVKNANVRVFVDLAENASLDVLEHFISLDENTETESLVVACTELDLAAGAILNHYRLNMHAESCFHIGGVHAALNKHATLNSFYLALGTQLTRIDASVKHIGEGAHTNMHGVYLPRKAQHVDFHTNLEHCVPNTTSNEVFRGIIGDSARAVFNGRIHIHPLAQKTNAQLSNKNLLTSNKAEVDTKPELEIYANDVQCAHGATVAQLNETSMHYMLTRGISEEEARVMLSFGFINELIQKIRLRELQDRLRPILAQRFATRADLTQHLL